MKQADGGPGLKALSRRNSLLVGITLFSMFFGAGNLILAPLLGYQASQVAGIATVGFLISAVGFPVLTMASVARAGSIRELADRISPRFSEFFGAAIYLSIGPCLAIPRTSSTAFEMLVPLFNASDIVWIQVLFSVVFFVVAYVLAMHPNKLTDIMGKISGPSLLILIVVLVGANVVNMPQVRASLPMGSYAQAPFMTGFITGYQTMDVLAALAFGIIVALNIQSLGLSDKKAVSLQVMKSGVIAGALLLLIYVGFAFLGYVMVGNMAPATNGAQVISGAAALQFGVFGTVMVAAIFLIACLNVCIGLICSISEYFYQNYPRFSYKTYAIVFTVFSCVLSNIGLTAILGYSVPLLSALYPVALCLMCMGLAQKTPTTDTYAWKAAVAVCLVISAAFAIRDGFFAGAPMIFDQLPLADLSLGWLIPTLATFALVWVVSKLKGSKAQA